VDTGVLEEYTVVLVNDQVDFFRWNDREVMTLLGIERYKPPGRRVTVDMGAIRFISNGADVMAPGIVAMPGRRPFSISASGFADSSLRQKAISSQTAGTKCCAQPAPRGLDLERRGGRELRRGDDDLVLGEQLVESDARGSKLVRVLREPSLDP
jgi:hypothetical protein